MSRLYLVLAPLAVLTVMVHGTGGSRQPSTSLWIESLTPRYPVLVRVITSSSQLQYSRVRPPETIVQLPVSLPIADSVNSIHLVVAGSGVVHAIVTEPGHDSVVAEGRDVTFARDMAGRFRRIWTAQPLIP